MKNRALSHCHERYVTNATGPYDGGVSSTPGANRPLSALPSPTARLAAFIAILIAGLAGALIGAAMVDLQCTGRCDAPIGIGLLIGSLIGAGGMSIVAVLVLRAVGEWRELADRESHNS